MNKNEQLQLCMLLVKLRYEIVESIINEDDESYFDECHQLIEAINRVLAYTPIDGSNK